jgi:tight adherence protein B
VQPGLIAPGVILSTVFCGSAIVLYLDARRRQQLRQLEIATRGAPPSSARLDQPQTIRRHSTGRAWLRPILHWLLRYHPEAPRLWPVSRVVLSGVVGGVGACAVALTTLPFWAAVPVGVGAGLLLVRALFGWQEERYADRLLRQLPDTIELVVSAVRAGLPASEAFRGVAREMPDPTREQFRHVVSELALGRPADEALLNVYRRTRVSEYAIFAVTLSVQAKSGGRLAETIQTLAETVRQRIAIAGRAKALAGEAKLSGRVLASLPFLSGSALSVVHPGYLNPLLHDPRGRGLLAYGVVSLLFGVLTMRQMIKKGTSV